MNIENHIDSIESRLFFHTSKDQMFYDLKWAMEQLILTRSTLVDLKHSLQKALKNAQT